MEWRPRPESNRGAWICNPLRNHSATRPHAGIQHPASGSLSKRWPVAKRILVQIIIYCQRISLNKLSPSKIFSKRIRWKFLMEEPAFGEPRLRHRNKHCRPHFCLSHPPGPYKNPNRAIIDKNSEHRADFTWQGTGCFAICRVDGLFQQLNKPYSPVAQW